MTPGRKRSGYVEDDAGSTAGSPRPHEASRSADEIDAGFISSLDEIGRRPASRIAEAGRTRARPSTARSFLRRADSRSCCRRSPGPWSATTTASRRRRAGMAPWRHRRASVSAAVRAERPATFPACPPPGGKPASSADRQRLTRSRGNFLVVGVVSRGVRSSLWVPTSPPITVQAGRETMSCTTEPIPVRRSSSPIRVSSVRSRRWSCSLRLMSSR